MSECKTIRKDELEELMRKNQSIFDVVRIVEPESTTVVSFGDKGLYRKDLDPCFSVWNKDERCSNCISRRACLEKKRFTKFEFRDTETYSVIAVPFMVVDDGIEYLISLELVNHISNDLILQTDGNAPIINEIKILNRKLYEDSLTGTFNRRYYDEKQFIYEMTNAMPKKLGFIVVDVNNFKRVNDVYGHENGDLLLAEVAGVLKKNVRYSDKVMRIGGDEFLIVIRDCSRAAVEFKVNQIKNAVREIRLSQFEEYAPSVATGISYTDAFNGQDDMLHNLFREADEEMYKNKHSAIEDSRNYVRILKDDKSMQLSNVMENISVGVFVAKLEQGKTQILVANPAICEMLGTDPRKTIGTSNDDIMKLVHPEDVHIIRKVMDTLSKPEQSIDFETRNLNKKTGKYIWLSAKGRSVAQEDGSILAYICYFDITEQKKLQKIQENLEIEMKSEKNKHNFLTTMSHEIRTPMNAILGMTHLAADAVEPNSEAEGYLLKIKDSGDYLLGIINDILEMSRMSDGKMELNKEWIQQYKIFNSVFDMVEPLMKAKNITLEYNSKILKPAGIEAYLDPQKMKQLLMNVLNNACKFTDEGGHVKVSFRNLTIDREKNIATDQIIIEDDGCGISEEFLPKLFVPFEQERLGSNAHVPGTGLGMPISRNIARAMGGDITVKSKLGEGTQFTISFPCQFRIAKEENELQDNENTADILTLVGTRILLAEDHPLNAEIAVKLLERKGMIVTRVNDGASAVETFAINPAGTYAAILMDVKMPNMDGITATKAIRTLDKEDAKSIPIIAMTANAFDEDEKASIDAGMNAHLSKPIEPEKLYKTLAEYINIV